MIEGFYIFLIDVPQAPISLHRHVEQVQCELNTACVPAYKRKIAGAPLLTLINFASSMDKELYTQEYVG